MLRTCIESRSLRTYHGHWHYSCFDSHSVFTLKRVSRDWSASLTCVCWRSIKTKHSRASHWAFYGCISLRMCRFCANVFRESVSWLFVRALSASKWSSAWAVMSSTVKFTSDEILGGKWRFVSSNDASSCQSNIAAISHAAADA